MMRPAIARNVAQSRNKLPLYFYKVTALYLSISVLMY